jgi:hypothetical protein
MKVICITNTIVIDKYKRNEPLLLKAKNIHYQIHKVVTGKITQAGLKRNKDGYHLDILLKQKITKFIYEIIN